MNQSQQIENIDQHHARIDITKLAERVFQLEEWKNSMDQKKLRIKTLHVIYNWDIYYMKIGFLLIYVYTTNV